jgi:CBS domain-containing protein
MGDAGTKDKPYNIIGELVPKAGRGAVAVRTVLQRKTHRGVVTIGPKASVFDALRLMADHNVGAVIVLDEGKVLGVLSERDYARKVILIGKTSRETAVTEIMGTPAMTVPTSATVAECLALMTGRFLRHLPVVEDGRLVGLVSIGDLVKELIADQEERIGRIEAYISGTYPA